MEPKRLDIIDEDFKYFIPGWKHSKEFMHIYKSRFNAKGFFQEQASDTFKRLIDSEYSFYDLSTIEYSDKGQKRTLKIFMSECVLLGYISQSYKSIGHAKRDGYSIEDFLEYTNTTEWMTQMNPITSRLFDYLKKQISKNTPFLKLKPDQEEQIIEAATLNIMLGHHVAVWEGL